MHVGVAGRTVLLLVGRQLEGVCSQLIEPLGPTA